MRSSIEQEGVNVPMSTLQQNYYNIYILYNVNAYIYFSNLYMYPHGESLGCFHMSTLSQLISIESHGCSSGGHQKATGLHRQRADRRRGSSADELAPEGLHLRRLGGAKWL